MNRYSPGIDKLLLNPRHICRIMNRDAVAPLHVSVWPVAKCQMNCDYCMGKKMRSDAELSIDEFDAAMKVLSERGTGAIEFSGAAGEPLLWKHFDDAVESCVNYGLRMSLITNGLLLDMLKTQTIKRFSWIRISIQSINQAKEIIDCMPYLNKVSNISASIILPVFSGLEWITGAVEMLVSNGIVCRIACERPCNEDFSDNARKFVATFGNDLVFFSEKETGAPLGCYSPWVRAAIDNDGYFLPCPAIQLSEESRGKIENEYRLCHINNLSQWLDENRPRDIGYRCSFCNCGKTTNDYLHQLLNGDDDDRFFV